MRWVEKYNEEGSIKRHDRQIITYKVTNEEVKYILDEIKKNKTITMEDLLIKVKLNNLTLILLMYQKIKHEREN